jgi:tRNA 2-thiouridine synthesizing protein A
MTTEPPRPLDTPPPTARLDTSGLSCPLPVLKARKALARLAPGDTLEVVATDPHSPADFAALCDSQGHRLAISEERDGVFRFLLVRASPGGIDRAAP